MRLIVLTIQGEFQQGCTVTGEVFQFGQSTPLAGAKGKLIANNEIGDRYQQWQKAYLNLSSCFSFLIKRSATLQITNLAERSDADLAFNLCRQAANTFKQVMNDWLDSQDFQPIKQLFLNYLQSDEEFRVLVKTDNLELRRLPWNGWQFLAENFSQAEVTFTSPEFERISQLPATPTLKDKVRTLAIFGNDLDSSSGQEILTSLPSDAEVKIIELPTKEQLNRELLENYWDILFFAGHSMTYPDGRGGEFQINANERLKIADLKTALKIAIRGGLKLAIFNSCDGLGLAQQLAEGQQLYLPQIIVMREPIPDKLAPQFLKYFLQEFTQGNSLYNSLRTTRNYLKTLESDFPCASWLPVLVQNPAEVPPFWQDLGRRPTNICPYKGLSAFRSQDAQFFFGRDTVVSELVEAVKTKTLVGIIGASGVGKSSVVLAGLIPHLTQEGNFKIADFRPGNNPFASLAIALTSIQQPASSYPLDRLSELELSVELEKSNRSFDRAINNILASNIDGKFILIADQFEELYTISDSSQRQIFLDRLLNAVNRIPNFTLVLTLRADFLGFAFTYSPFFNALMDGYHRLEVISYKGMKAAIEKPAELLDVSLESGLSDRILEDLGTEPGSLPLLEFTLTQLWTELAAQNGKLFLTHQAYARLGGVKKALANYADRIWEQLDRNDKKRAEQLFIQLVNFGFEESNLPTRRLATRAEIGEPNWELAIRLASSRLVVMGCNELTGEETVEIVHEALINNWDILGLWLQINREFGCWREQLRLRMRQWQNRHQHPTALLQGILLKDAEKWLQQRSPELSDAEKNFIRRSQARRSRQQRNQILVLIVVLAIVFTSGGLIYTLQQQWSLQRVRNVAAGTELPTPELRQILPRFQKETDKLRDRGNIDRAIADYSYLLKAAQKIPELELAAAAEKSLADTIREYRLPQLAAELKQGNFGKQIDYNFAKFENQYTGGLRITYAILMRKFGVNADSNNDGILNEGEETALPCQTLKDIEELWRKFTGDRCYWYGDNTAFIPHCRELGGKSLTGMLIYPPAFAEMENRLNECQIMPHKQS
jgi:energy-coupling factor transporter ATP-binding protein EcfA2